MGSDRGEVVGRGRRARGLRSGGDGARRRSSCCDGGDRRAGSDELGRTGMVGRAVVARNLWRQPTRRLCIYAATRPDRSYYCTGTGTASRLRLPRGVVSLSPSACPRLRARPKLHAGRARVDIFGRFGATCMGAVHAPAGHGQHSRLRFRTCTLPEYNT